jgi:hypothetical protein
MNNPYKTKTPVDGPPYKIARAEKGNHIPASPSGSFNAATSPRSPTFARLAKETPTVTPVKEQQRVKTIWGESLLSQEQSARYGGKALFANKVKKERGFKVVPFNTGVSRMARDLYTPDGNAPFNMFRNKIALRVSKFVGVEEYGGGLKHVMNFFAIDGDGCGVFIAFQKGPNYGHAVYDWAKRNLLGEGDNGEKEARKEIWLFHRVTLSEMTEFQKASFSGAFKFELRPKPLFETPGYVGDTPETYKLEDRAIFIPQVSVKRSMIETIQERKADGVCYSVDLVAFVVKYNLYDNSPQVQKHYLDLTICDDVSFYSRIVVPGRTGVLFYNFLQHQEAPYPIVGLRNVSHHEDLKDPTDPMEVFMVDPTSEVYSGENISVAYPVMFEELSKARVDYMATVVMQQNETFVHDSTDNEVKEKSIGRRKKNSGREAISGLAEGVNLGENEEDVCQASVSTQPANGKEAAQAETLDANV